MGYILFFIFRILLLFPMFLYFSPFYFLALITDLFDYQVLSYFDTQSYLIYQTIDKTADILLFAVATLAIIFHAYSDNIKKFLYIKSTLRIPFLDRYEEKFPVSRGVAKAVSFMFIYRFVGFIIYEITKNRFILLLFPNYIEYFLMFYAGFRIIYKKEPDFKNSYIRLILILLLIIKIVQEYLLHNPYFDIWAFLGI